MKLPSYDKLLHILAGLLVFMLAVVFITPEWALASAATVGVLKEVYDYWKRHKHTPEAWDALATAAGGVAGYVCTLF